MALIGDHATHAGVRCRGDSLLLLHIFTHLEEAARANRRLSQ